MQKTLSNMANMIGWIGLSVATLVFGLLCLYWIIDIATEDRYVAVV